MDVKNLIRCIFSVIFLAGGIMHIYLITSSPALYESFADFSFLEVYTSMWHSIILPNLSIWVSVLIVFEFAVSILLLNRDPFARIGFILAAIFILFLVPFWWNGGAIINIVFFIVVVWLLRYRYPRSIPALLRKK
jgi:hypothetical protein